MLTLFTWTTPNGLKPLIMLEELRLPNTIKPVNVKEGAQHAAAFLRVNPNGKIPALLDDLSDGDARPGAKAAQAPLRVFESGAILIYLAEKSGQFLPTQAQPRAETLAWLMFQMAGIGPMFGQLSHFRSAKRDDPYPLERYRNEALRLLDVVNNRLAEAEYLAGDYSIADMASYGWLSALDRFGLDTAAYPHLQRYLAAVGARPAVQRAVAWKP